MYNIYIDMTMRKTLFLLFAGLTLAATAQTVETTKADAKDTATCDQLCRQQTRPGRRTAKAVKACRAGQAGSMAFMKNLSEADRTTVKSLMEDYRKECKAARDKVCALKPAKDAKPTEKEMDALVNARMDCRMAVLKLQEKYYDKLRKILTPGQASTLLGMNGKGAKRPNNMHVHKGNCNRQGHHACGRTARCPHGMM